MTDQSPVYMIAMLDITDMGAFTQDYVGPLQPINRHHGVELMMATAAPKVLEGRYDKSLTVVLKFPSAEAQAAWYEDPEYQALLKRRRELTDTETSVALVIPAA